MRFSSSFFCWYCTKEFAEGGYNLSGGEEQKLLIARALYRRGRILILDEPNSAPDAIAEKNLFARANEMEQNKITILFSAG